MAVVVAQAAEMAAAAAATVVVVVGGGGGRGGGGGEEGSRETFQTRVWGVIGINSTMDHRLSQRSPLQYYQFTS